MKEASHRPLIRLKVVVLSVVMLILALVGAMAYVWFSEYPIYPSYNPNHPTVAQQRAIDAAVAWRREGGVRACFMAVTPAVHPATGARYVFTDSCIAPGWVSEE